MLSHPGDKNNCVARVGHPDSFGSRKDFQKTSEAGREALTEQRPNTEMVADSAASTPAQSAEPVAAASNDKAAAKAQSELDTMTEMAGQARDVASNASDSIAAYTKKNPVKALAIAAASGALLYAVIKALSPSPD